MAPIDLTTPYKINEIDPDTEYTKFKISSYSVDVDSKKLIIVAYFLKYDEEDEVWVAGLTQPKLYSVEGDAFDALVTENQTIYNDMKTVLYALIKSEDDRIIGDVS